MLQAPTGRAVDDRYPGQPGNGPLSPTRSRQLHVRHAHAQHGLLEQWRRRKQFLHNGRNLRSHVAMAIIGRMYTVGTDQIRAISEPLVANRVDERRPKLLSLSRQHIAVALHR